MHNKKKRIIFLVIIGLIIVFLIIKISKEIKEGITASNEYLPETYYVLPEDSSLISKKYIKYIKSIEVRNSKVRHPVSTLLFDKRYHIVVYKIDLEKDNSMDSLFIESHRNAETSIGYGYGIIANGTIYQFMYLTGMPEAAQKLYLTLAGDSIQTIVKNDSILSYHLLCSNISIRYKKDAPVDVLLQSSTSLAQSASITRRLHIRKALAAMDVLFLKRNKSIYLLVMTPKEEGEEIAPDLLYRIVTER